MQSRTPCLRSNNNSHPRHRRIRTFPPPRPQQSLIAKSQAGNRGSQTTGSAPTLRWCPGDFSCEVEALKKGTRKGLGPGSQRYIVELPFCPKPSSGPSPVLPDVYELCDRQATDSARRARLAGVALVVPETQVRMPRFGIGATAFVRRVVSLKTLVPTQLHISLFSGLSAK